MAAAEAAPVVPIDDVRTQLAKMEAQMSADASFQLSPEGAQLQQRAMEVEELTKTHRQELAAKDAEIEALKAQTK